METAVDFEIIRVSLALAMFATASFFDLKKRSVNDLLWVAFGAAAGIIYVFDFPADYGEGMLTLIAIAFTAAISYGIYRVGFFGGADMLALITFSAILPLYDGLFGSVVLFHPMAPLIVLMNAVILSMSQIIFNVLRNLAYSSRHPQHLFEGLEHESTTKKIFAVIIGHRSEKPKYAFPIERTVDGKREFDFTLKSAETAEYEMKQDVWVTSGTPFLVYLLAGLIVMIFGGDMMAFIFGPLLN